MARCALSVSTLAIPKALASWTTLSIDGVGGSRAANQLVCGLRRVSAPCRFLCCPAPWCVFGLFACIPEFPEACWTSDPVGFMYTVVQSFGFVVYAHNLRVDAIYVHDDINVDIIIACPGILGGGALLLHCRGGTLARSSS